MSERTNCGRCGGDRFLTSWEDKVRCPECGNADPDDVPAPAAYAPRAEELEYTVQESFVIQHEDGGDIIGIPVIEGITAQEAQAQGMKWINERIRPVRYRLVHRTVVTTDKMV